MSVLWWSCIEIQKSWLGLYEQAKKVFCSTATNQNKVYVLDRAFVAGVCIICILYRILCNLAVMSVAIVLIKLTCLLCLVVQDVDARINHLDVAPTTSAGRLVESGR